MTDFEPVTDVPQRIDEDDTPVESSARMRDAAIQGRRNRVLVVVVLAIAAGLMIAGYEPWRVAVSSLAMYLMLRLGFAIVGAFARPVPDAPPPGELRRVRLKYRCSSCGTQIRMTLANDEVPEAPRHCADEMELIATEDDAL